MNALRKRIMNTAKIDPIHIDGTTLEGGGQLLRLSLALSSITGLPFHITDIRGKRGPRSKPGKDGGMKQAHLAGAQWLALATNADAGGLELKSRELLFRPNTRNHEESKVLAPDAAETISNEGTWKYVYDGSRVVRKESTIAITSPGSVFLILQAIIPWILFASSESEPPGNTLQPVPIRITLKGGTNVSHSMSHEYCEQVLFPILERKVGLSPFKLKLVKRGWSLGTFGIGEVVVEILPLAPGAQLPAFTFTDRGELLKISVSILAPHLSFRKAIKNSTIEQLLNHFPDVDIEFPVDEDSGHGTRVYLLLVAETSNGYLLGRDWLYDERVNRDNPQKTVDRLVSKVVKHLRAELAHGGCVDEFLQDQLVVFQTLAAGKSVVKGNKPSLHAQTARWLAERLVGIKFDEEGTCDGMGLVIGKTSSTDTQA